MSDIRLALRMSGASVSQEKFKTFSTWCQYRRGFQNQKGQELGVECAYHDSNRGGCFLPFAHSRGG
jgi:hypothetical protein